MSRLWPAPICSTSTSRRGAERNRARDPPSSVIFPRAALNFITVPPPPAKPVPMRCPVCDTAVQVPRSLAGQSARCPSCGATFRVKVKEKTEILTPAAATVQITPPATMIQPAALPESDVALAGTAELNRVKRSLSLPWVIMISIFGFLPWSEVSCNSKALEVQWRASQSGYQALYGGISSPFDVLEEAYRDDQKQVSMNKQALSKQIETKRSNFLMACSPFMMLFWTAALATLSCILWTPLSTTRLKMCLVLAGFMAAMLLITLIVGTPLELRVNRAVYEEIKRDPHSALIMSAAIISGKTPWFWLTFTAVLLIGLTEAFSNLMWKTLEYISPITFIGIGTTAAVLALSGVGLQFILWELGLTAMESRLAQIHHAEQERERARQEAARQRQLALEQERERQGQLVLEQERERQRKQREQREAFEARQRELAQERERQRLAAMRQADEERQQQRRDARKRAEEEATRRREEEEREAERKRDLEARGVAYYPKPMTLYENRNAQEWHRIAHHAQSPITLKQALTALKALKEEGMPFLMSELEKSLGARAWQKVAFGLDFIDPEYVHANDLPKIVACLKKVDSARYRDNPARVQALRHLRKRKESKKHIDQIEELVTDLKRHTTYGAEVRELLEAIKTQK